MIVAHLSDLHLGFRAYGRVEEGSDLRERDIAAAFERASQEVARVHPGLVLIAGDVFDRPDPRPGAVVALARGLEVFRASVPETPVIMVAGPRDTPRRPGDPGALAVFDTFPNVEAATGLPRSILIEKLDLHVCLLPYRAITRHPPALPEPDPRMKWNVLVLHAETRGKSGEGVHVDPTEWSYVALGGEHRRRKIAPRAWYCGSLERVALDPWEEAADDKGFLVADLESGHTSFRPVPGRPVVALAPVKVGLSDPERIRRRVAEVTAEVPGGIDGKIVRLRLEGATPSDLLALQGEPLQKLKSRALHLAVEGGEQLRVPADAWLPVEGLKSLGTAVKKELEHDGLLEEGAEAIIREVIGSGDPVPMKPHGAVTTLDGEALGIGRISTSIPLGLTAVLGGGRGRKAVAELLVRLGRTGEPGAIAELWADSEVDTLEGTMHRAISAVAESRGLGVVRAALERLSASDGGQPPEAGDADEKRRQSPGKLIQTNPKKLEMEFSAADHELTKIRSDVAEADRDLEAAMVGWLRERQDAETTLQAYRDRARELRHRIRRMESAGPEAPCPTCGRVLESHYRDVLAELREQWESVVQDGSWWRSRWEQLEMKPPPLQELEARSLRLHAALETGSERVELLRARSQEMKKVGSSEPVHLSGPEQAVVMALQRVRSARLARATRMLVQRASHFVGTVSGGRILAVSWDETRVRLEGSEGLLAPVSEEDLAAGQVAIRVAAAALIAAEGRVLATLPISEPFDRLDEEAQIRTLILVRSILSEIPRVVLFTRGDVVDARPEFFDYVLEVRDESNLSGPAIRPALAGPGRVTFKLPVPPVQVKAM